MAQAKTIGNENEIWLAQGPYGARQARAEVDTAISVWGADGSAIQLAIHPIARKSVMVEGDVLTSVAVKLL